jgi:hypothetical protein
MKKHYHSKVKIWLIGFLLLMFNLSIFTQAQTFNVRGKVISDGEPVIGALVSIKGTQKGTVTDIDGNFSLESSVGQTLVISFVGYGTKEVLVQANQGDLTINLAYTTSDLSEVVVVGYGSQIKKENQRRKR